MQNISFLYKERKEISVRYDAEEKAVWCYFNPKTRPSYSYTMLEELHDLQTSLIKYIKEDNRVEINYLIGSSQIHDIYNYGGDLNLFYNLIKNKDRETLYKYGKKCIDIVYLNKVNLHLPITTISLVEGTALGGGFEAALSSNFLIAEESAKFGFPEIRFNLFPGMGAYSFLARDVGIRKAEEIITSGKVYTAKELHDNNVNIMLAEKGKGREVLNAFIKKHSKTLNGRQSIMSARHIYDEIKYSELEDIVNVWVESALNIQEKDLKVMKKLIASQNIKAEKMNFKKRTGQDRRVCHNFDFLENTYHGVERRTSQDKRV